VLTIAQKKEAVAELRDKFARAKGIFVADYSGLDVEAVNQLRRSLRAEGDGDCEYRVNKNTLLRRAAEGSDVESISKYFVGPTALAISYGDPAGLARALVDYAKEHLAFELRGGLLDRRAVDTDEIKTLATLPSLDQIRATLAGLIQAPARKIAMVLCAPAGQLARVVEARRAAMEESGDGA
jgi:large subunit ribosomal protein L10